MTRLDSTRPLNYTKLCSQQTSPLLFFFSLSLLFANLLPYYRLIAIKVNVVGLFFYQFRTFSKNLLKIHYISCSICARYDRLSFVFQSRTLARFLCFGFFSSMHFHHLFGCNQITRIDFPFVFRTSSIGNGRLITWHGTRLHTTKLLLQFVRWW